LSRAMPPSQQHTLRPGILIPRCLGQDRGLHAVTRFFCCREAGAVRLTLDRCMPGLLATDVVLIPSSFTAQ